MANIASFLFKMIIKPKTMTALYLCMLVCGLFIVLLSIMLLLKSHGRSINWFSLLPVGIEKSGLSIEPSKKHIAFSKTGDNWNEEFYVYLVNHSDKTFYDVNIALDYPKYIGVSFMPEEQSATMKLGTETNNKSIGADFMILYGEDEEVGLIGGQTVINNIGPGEKKKIKVKVTKKASGEDFDLKFKIDNYSNDPKPILGK